MITRDQIDQAVGILVHEASPEKVILFGSWARNEAGPDSDADFLVITPEKTNRFATATRLRRSLSPLRIPVDIVVHDRHTIQDWAEVPGTLIYTVMHEGTVCYEKR